MNTIRILALVAAMFLAASAHAQRQPVPIVNHENVAVTTSSATEPTAEAVTRAIISGAQTKKWTVTHVAGSPKIQAKLFVRNKHTVVVEIENTANTYSIRYVSSIDMKYGTQDGVPVIHPYYNRWVSELMDGIRSELTRL